MPRAISGQAVRRARELCPQLREVCRRRALGCAQVQHQRHEPLLGPVVQVAFDPPPGMVGGGDDSRPGGRELGTAVLQRARHRVEAASQHADLAGTAPAQPRAEVSGGDPAGHGRGPSQRSHDRRGEVAGEQADEQDGSGQAGPGQDEGLRRLRVGAVLARQNQLLLGRDEPVELVSDGVQPPLPILGGRDHPYGGRIPQGRVDERHGVVAEVGTHRLADLPGARPLVGVAAVDDPLQARGLRGKGGPGG